MSQHGVDGGLGAQEDALHVDPVHPVEIGLARALDRADVGDAGVVHENVEPAEPRLDGAEGAPDAVGAGDIARPRVRRVARGPDLVGRPLRRRVVHVQRGNRRPRAGEHPGDRPADAGPGARHGGGLSVQCEHRWAPCGRVTSRPRWSANRRRVYVIVEGALQRDRSALPRDRSTGGVGGEAGNALPSASTLRPARADKGKGPPGPGRHRCPSSLSSNSPSWARLSTRGCT